MSIYDELGVVPVLNAAGTLTAYGGSRMPAAVLEAMNDAAGSFVDMHELHRAAGRRLAGLTKNEGAHVTSGCAAALVLGTLACATEGDPRLIDRMPVRDGPVPEVVMHCSHRIPYDPAIRLAGARVVQIGNALQTFDWELEGALGPNTVAVLYVAGQHLAGAALPLEETIEIAHRNGVAVIVDAAAQLPPASNLWHFTAELGADLAVFSGGKGLRGPQASGLMVGKAELIEAAMANASPHQRLARALKVGKEEIAGLVRAVELYLQVDHDAARADSEEVVARWIALLEGVPGVCADRDFPNEAGQPTPRVRLEVDPQVIGMTIEDVCARLLNEEPRVLTLPGPDCTYMTPELLCQGDRDLVELRLRELFRPGS